MNEMKKSNGELVAALAPFTVTEIAWELEQRKILEQLTWKNVMRPTGRKMDGASNEAHAQAAFWAGYSFFVDYIGCVWKLAVSGNMLLGWEITQFTVSQVR